MKRLVSLCLCIILALQLFPAMLVVHGAENNSRMLKVLGNKVVLEEDANIVVRLTGLNVPGAEWTGTPGVERLERSAKEAMENWSSNIIRLPVGKQGWFGEYTYITDTNGTKYREYIDRVIKMASAAGKYVILDLHHYHSFNNVQYLTFWQQAAEKYKNNPTVLFGILNEPTTKPWSLWRDGNGDDITGHQQVIEMIRDLGARNIIIAGGLDYAYDLRGVSGEAGDGIVYELIDQGSNDDLTKTGNGIIYDTHIYPWKGTTASWHRAVGAVRKKHPILVGENGFDPSDGTQKQYAPNAKHEVWVPELFAWMNDEETYGNLANWTGWSFHTGASPRILGDKDNFKKDDYSFTPTDYWGVYVKAQLKKDLGDDLTVGKSATASEGTDVSAVNDDINTTGWICTTDGDRYVTIDLGQQKSFDRWLVRHSSANDLFVNESTAILANTADFKLQVSDNGTTWTDVDEVIGNTVGVTDRFINKTTGKYVRLYISRPAQAGNESKIFQFSVYGAKEPLVQLAPPVASAPSGEVPIGGLVTLSTTEQDAEIMYTIDDSAPGDLSTKYTGAIPVTKDFKLKAVTTKRGNLDSETITYSYTLPTVQSIRVEDAKTEYMVGESFVNTVGKVIATYSSGQEFETLLSNKEVVVEGFSSSAAADVLPLTVSYLGLTTTHNITVRSMDALAPHGITRVAHDDFVNTTPTDSQSIMLLSPNESFPEYPVYSGGIGFDGGWMMENGTPIPYVATCSATNPIAASITTNNQLYVVGRTTMVRKLETPIDLSVDGEYYLVYNYLAKSHSSYTNMLRLGNAERATVLGVGEMSPNSPNTYGAPTGAFTANGTNTQSTRLMPADNASYVVAVLNISARKDSADIYRMKSFLLKNDEVPTFTPTSWDIEGRVVNSTNYTVLDRVALTFSDNNGGYGARTVNELSLYKGTPVIVDKVHPGSEANYPARNMPFTNVGDVLTASVSDTNVYGNPQRITSARWLDGTDLDNYKELAAGHVYTVPADMLKRRLVLELTIEDMTIGDIVIQYPFTQFISDTYEIDTQFFTNGNTGNSLGRIGAIKLTDTKIGARAVIKRTNTVAADKKTSADKCVVTLAQYSADGKLKAVTSAQTAALNINPNASVNTSPILTSISIEEDDYFKSYVFYSKDTAQPLRYNLNNYSHYIINDSRNPMK